MASVNDSLIQIQTLTKKNLEILKAINDSFFTKQNHLTVKVGDASYVMPSFISLENKINSLQAAFENLVNAPSTGEAYFNFDGDSRAIEVRGYTHTPLSISLDKVDEFGVEQNDIFKDFLTPVPYINIPLQTLPNDITSVNVKKVIPKSEQLVDVFRGKINEDSSIQMTWADIYKVLSLYKEDKDYIMYDTIHKLPVRKNIGHGVYAIDKVISDIIDENLNNYITIKLRNDLPTPYSKNLSYKRFDETIEIPLKVGDQLVTFDDSAKMQITEINQISNTITVHVLYGEYLNLTESKGSEIEDSSKLKFFSPVDFDKDKYINIPLEEDQYVFVAIAAINDRMNIQSPWGSGLIVNTHILQNNGKKFVDYYKENVKNIGDVLYEVTSMFSGTMSKMNEDEFNALYNYKPILNESNIKVSHINKHLNDSVTVKNIRALYSQKKKYNTELDEIQKKITITNSKLAEISFDDTNNMRAVYTAELTEYNKKKNELVTSITKIMDEISLSANNSEVPIEDAKYRIRGYYKLSDNEDHIVGINVQYRYKNIDTPQTNAESFNGEFIYSDWNVMDSIYRKKLTKYDGQLIYKLEDDNSNKNEPSFNQIDIPISQGETVDIRLKVIYDYGYPFVEVSSQWSDIINIKFPDEYLKDVQVLDIIKENNNDIETNRFQNMLRDAGIPEHIGDKIIDQDITYFHKPENIASGFYTAERRIIPLKDKLSEINSHIIALRDEVLGTSSSQIDINIINGDIASKLYPYQNNKIFVESYNTINNTNDDNSLKDNGVYAINNGIVSTVLNISISNTSQRSVKIFSLFPGSRGTSINAVKNYKFDKKDYCDNNGGVYLKYHTGTKLQGCNQLLTFRIKDAYNGVEYYSNDQDWYMKDNVLYLNDWKSLNDLDGIKFGANMYPMIKEEYALVIDDSNAQPYMILSPGEEIIVPVIFEYVLKDDNNSISKTMSFDIRTSLYNDPINYTFQVIANKENTTQDKLINTNKKYINAAKYHTTVIK